MKIKIFLFALILSFSSLAQTDVDAFSLGWSEKALLQLPEAIVMPGYNQAKIDAEDKVNDLDKTIPWRFGYIYKTNISLSNSGQWTNAEEGRYWNAVITCPNAMTINLMLEDFYLPEGATLFLYDKDRTNKIGAYTSKNNRLERQLGTELIHGETIIVEYFEPIEVFEEGSFKITGVVHGYRSLSRIQKDLSKGLNDSGACNIDVNCDLGEEWSTEIRSIAMIIVDGNGVCSGALINNTCQDGRPLFLTADHCLSEATAFWAFRFNWESPEGTEVCADWGDSVDPGPPYDQTANGATILANATISDFALLEIDNITEEEIDAWNVYFSGWDRSDNETVNKATGIHHPSADLKKICQEVNAPYHAVDEGVLVWWIDDWDFGVTEPGSSGSPLFDQNHRIIGQLYGGYAACSGTVDNDQQDSYGRLGISWVNGAQEILSPAMCSTDSIPEKLDGFDPENDCPMVLTSTITNPLLCYGDINGTLSIIASEGTPPYTYDIGDGPIDSGNFSELSAGTYLITVIDSVGCTKHTYTTINQPAALMASYTSEHEVFGEDGSIDLTVSGGVPPYTYSWSDYGAFYSTDEDISELESGLYTVNITDANGCSLVLDSVEVSSSATINEEDINILIYPNPTDGAFQIVSKGNKIENLSVIDIQGRTIINQLNNEENSTVKLDLEGEPSGIYVITLTTNRKTYKTRVIKK